MRSSYGSCVHILKRNKKVKFHLLLYVDDMLMESFRKGEIGKFNETLNREFEIKDLGKTKRVLGVDIIRNCKRSDLFFSQSS